MEGSMKMMSWSRYHLLPKSLSRAARHCRAVKLREIQQRGRTAHQPEPRSESEAGASDSLSNDRPQASSIRLPLV
jgi:hypothetical protein